MLEFFDYFLIGYVVAFIAGPWQLTFGQSAVILLSSGFGAMFGAVFFGWLADQIGRRRVFMLTVHQLLDRAPASSPSRRTARGCSSP